MGGCWCVAVHYSVLRVVLCLMAVGLGLLAASVCSLVEIVWTDAMRIHVHDANHACRCTGRCLTSY